MRPLGLLRSFASLSLCTATWAMDPTDTIMDAGELNSMCRLFSMNRDY